MRLGFDLAIPCALVISTLRARELGRPDPAAEAAARVERQAAAALSQLMCRRYSGETTASVKRLSR